MSKERTLQRPNPSTRQLGRSPLHDSLNNAEHQRPPLDLAPIGSIRRNAFRPAPSGATRCLGQECRCACRQNRTNAGWSISSPIRWPTIVSAALTAPFRRIRDRLIEFTDGRLLVFAVLCRGRNGREGWVCGDSACCRDHVV